MCGTTKAINLGGSKCCQSLCCKVSRLKRIREANFGTLYLSLGETLTSYSSVGVGTCYFTNDFICLLSGEWAPSLFLGTTQPTHLPLRSHTSV